MDESVRMPRSHSLAKPSLCDTAPAEQRPRVRLLKATAVDAGRRLDNYLFTHFKGVPKSRIYRAIRGGQVRINSGRVPPSKRLVAGDMVRVPPLTVTAPPLRHVNERLVRDFESCILFEDRHFLVLDKPAGVVVHGGSRHGFGLAEVSQWVRGDGRFPALMHRLDRGTSGCLLFAKSAQAMQAAQQAFREREVSKAYTALVVGKWDKTARHVDQPLMVRKQVSAAGRKVIVDEVAGKPARTDFKIIRRFDGYTLLCAVPLTGRMHQIRVHAAAQRCPIAGDRRYGDFAANRRLGRLGLKRLFLHASHLSLHCLGNAYRFEAPLPAVLSSLLEQLSES